MQRYRRKSAWTYEKSSDSESDSKSSTPTSGPGIASQLYQLIDSDSITVEPQTSGQANIASRARSLRAPSNSFAQNDHQPTPTTRRQIHQQQQQDALQRIRITSAEPVSSDSSRQFTRTKNLAALIQQPSSSENSDSSDDNLRSSPIYPDANHADISYSSPSRGTSQRDVLTQIIETPTSTSYISTRLSNSDDSSSISSSKTDSEKQVDPIPEIQGSSTTTSNVEKETGPSTPAPKRRARKTVSATKSPTQSSLTVLKPRQVNRFQSAEPGVKNTKIPEKAKPRANTSTNGNGSTRIHIDNTQAFKTSGVSTSTTRKNTIPKDKSKRAQQNRANSASSNSTLENADATKRHDFLSEPDGSTNVAETADIVNFVDPSILSQPEPFNPSIRQKKVLKSKGKKRIIPQDSVKVTSNQPKRVKKSIPSNNIVIQGEGSEISIMRKEPTRQELVEGLPKFGLPIYPDSIRLKLGTEALAVDDIIRSGTYSQTTPKVNLANTWVTPAYDSAMTNWIDKVKYGSKEITLPSNIKFDKRRSRYFPFPNFSKVSDQGVRLPFQKSHYYKVPQPFRLHIPFSARFRRRRIRATYPLNTKSRYVNSGVYPNLGTGALTRHFSYSLPDNTPTSQNLYMFRHGAHSNHMYNSRYRHFGGRALNGRWKRRVTFINSHSASKAVKMREKLNNKRSEQRKQESKRLRNQLVSHMVATQKQGNSGETPDTMTELIEEDNDSDDEYLDLPPQNPQYLTSPKGTHLLQQIKAVNTHASDDNPVATSRAARRWHLHPLSSSITHNPNHWSNSDGQHLPALSLTNQDLPTIYHATSQQMFQTRIQINKLNHQLLKSNAMRGYLSDNGHVYGSSSSSDDGADDDALNWAHNKKDKEMGLEYLNFMKNKLGFSIAKVNKNDLDKPIDEVGRKILKRKNLDDSRSDERKKARLGSYSDVNENIALLETPRKALRSSLKDKTPGRSMESSPIKKVSFAVGGSGDERDSDSDFNGGVFTQMPSKDDFGEGDVEDDDSSQSDYSDSDSDDDYVNNSKEENKTKQVTSESDQTISEYAKRMKYDGGSWNINPKTWDAKIINDIDAMSTSFQMFDGPGTGPRRDFMFKVTDPLRSNALTNFGIPNKAELEPGQRHQAKRYLHMDLGTHTTRDSKKLMTPGDVYRKANDSQYNSWGQVFCNHPQLPFKEGLSDALYAERRQKRQLALESEIELHCSCSEDNNECDDTVCNCEHSFFIRPTAKSSSAPTHTTYASSVGGTSASDFLTTLSTYASELYSALGYQQAFMSMDETALLAMGVIMEEAMGQVIGPHGHEMYMQREREEAEMNFSDLRKGSEIDKYFESDEEVNGSNDDEPMEICVDRKGKGIVSRRSTDNGQETVSEIIGDDDNDDSGSDVL